MGAKSSFSVFTLCVGFSQFPKSNNYLTFIASNRSIDDLYLGHGTVNP